MTGLLEIGSLRGERKVSTRIVGIDLGTTNSLVAYMEDGVPKVIGDEQGRLIVPSVVSFDVRNQAIVGDPAKDQRIANAARTIYSVKRFMGRSYEDVRADAHLSPFKIRPDEQGVIHFEIGSRTYTPPEISSFILRELKRRAEACLGTRATKAVITVPAYFNDSQRQATKDAGRLAGLEVLRIVNEPTAASLAYGLDRKREGIIAVYDLGGGTFDISILKLHAGIFEVLSTNGNTYLGGDDIDNLLMEMIFAEVAKQHGIDLRHDSEAIQRIKDASEKAKILLSQEEGTLIQVAFPQRGVAYKRDIGRMEFEERISPIVERTLGPCRMALEDAGLSVGDIDDVVLVGGSTQIPLVRKRVEEFFQRKPHTELNPEEVVALGAAIQADILAGGTTDMLLLDITPLSLGIETVGGIMTKVIHRNSTIPTSATETFTTFIDGQTNVDIHVLQGERELAKDNRSLARFQLKGIDPAPAGMPRIEVRFLIDADGILNVSAKDLRTGKHQSVEVKPSYGLTEEQVEEMIRASLEYAGEDVRQRVLIEARTEAESLIHATEKVLDEHAELVGEEERSRIVAALDRLRDAARGEDRQLIRERMQEVESVTTDLAHRVMDSSLRVTLQDRKLTDVL